jgi:hypothetical protein
MPDRSADAIDMLELERLRSLFLERTPDFGDFGDTVGEYWSQEREYKDELLELVTTLLPPSLFSTDEPEEVHKAALRALTARVRTGGETMPQNLVGWRYVDFVRVIPEDQKPMFAQALGDLLYGAGDEPDRVGRFTRRLWDVYPHAQGNPYALSRILPTYYLMFTNPRSNIAVRTDMFNLASKQLIGRSILLPTPFDAAGYRDVMLFSQTVFRLLETWAWCPRDMIDVHSFLWIATDPLGTRQKTPETTD